MHFKLDIAPASSGHIQTAVRTELSSNRTLSSDNSVVRFSPTCGSGRSVRELYLTELPEFSSILTELGRCEFGTTLDHTVIPINNIH